MSFDNDYDRGGSDEYELSASEREDRNSDAVDRLSDLIALRRVAYYLGFDQIGDACIALERDEMADMGVDLDDYDEVIERAESCTLPDADAATDLVSACEREERRRELVRARQLRRAA